MSYILVLFIGFGFNPQNYGNAEISHIEFNSLEACKKAGEQAKEIGNKTSQDYLKYICIQK